METSTPFDLNHALQQWRADLAQSSAFRGENLDELETHLRDSVATLQARDLSAEEAFYVAAKRVGAGAGLAKEFGKVNAMNVWVERCLWALVMMQAWTVVRTLFMAIGVLVQRKNGGMIPASFGWVAVSSILLNSILPITVAALFFWRLLNSPKSKVGHFLENLAIQPTAAALLFFLLSSAAQVFYTYMANYNNHVPGTARWMLYVWYLPAAIIYSGLIFLLARRRLLRKA